MFVAPGHFYSPIPSLDDVAAYGRRWATWEQTFPESIPGVDLRLDAQRALLDELAPLNVGVDFPSTGWRVGGSGTTTTRSVTATR